jgi:replicative DNA helicase
MGIDPQRVFRLSPGAAERLTQAQEALEPRLDPQGGDLGHIADWAGKLIGTTARIAGLLHAAEHLQDGYQQPVSEWH